MDTFSRRIVGWSASLTKQALVLCALKMALWQRDRAGVPIRRGELVHHSDAGNQYTSFALATHLDQAGVAPSVGTVGDALDNVLMESTIGLYKTELVKPRRPCKALGDVELATAEWVDWYNHAACTNRAHPASRIRSLYSKTPKNPRSQTQSRVSSEP